MATEPDAGGPEPIPAADDNNPRSSGDPEGDDSNSTAVAAEAAAGGEPPASPPLPAKHVPATPGPRAAGLREVYRRALERTLERVSWDNVAACYPTVAARAPATLRAVQGQMVGLLREKCDVSVFLLSRGLPRFFLVWLGGRLPWKRKKHVANETPLALPPGRLERIRLDPTEPERGRQAERAGEPGQRRGEEEEREPRSGAACAVSLPTYLPTYLPMQTTSDPTLSLPHSFPDPPEHNTKKTRRALRKS